MQQNNLTFVVFSIGIFVDRDRQIIYIFFIDLKKKN